MDSHVLLHLVASLRTALPECTFSALYVNHGLSENADSWQQHCAQVCANLNIDFTAINTVVETGARKSIEEAARKARYKTISSTVPKQSVVLLGQHQDDQVETLLLQLKRGAGPKGLASMGQQNVINGIAFSRPLLRFPQSQILEYANHYKLNWVEDESNQDTLMDRNFLRHQIIPSLKSRWPGVANAMSRSAELCAEQQLLLEEESEQKLRYCLANGNRLSIERLLEHHQGWIKQIIRLWLSKQNILMPSLAILNLVKPEVLEVADDANPILQFEQWQFRRFRGDLYVITVPVSAEINPIYWTGEQKVELPNALGCLHFLPRNSKKVNSELSFITEPDKSSVVEIKFGGFGARFKPAGSKVSKPLKQWLKEWHIPPWERKYLPLLYIDGQLAAVSDKYISKDFVEVSGKTGFQLQLTS